MRFQKIKKFLSKSKVWLIVLIMAAIAVLPFTMTKCSKSDAFTMWLASGEQDQYYMDYDDNPILKYLLKREWGEGEHKSKLAFDSQIAPSGSQSENFTTLTNNIKSCSDIMALDYAETPVSELYKNGIAMDLTEYVLGPNGDGEGSLMPNYYNLACNPETADPAIYREAINYVDGEKKVLQICSLNDAGRDMYQGLMYRRDWLLRFGEMPEYVWAVDPETLLRDYKHKDENGVYAREKAAPVITNYNKARAAYGSDESKWTANGWKKNPLYKETDEYSWEVSKGGKGHHGIECNYGADPMNDFTDNLVFPSGLSDPYFLSDWEWMFETYENKVWGNPEVKDADGNVLQPDSNTYMMSVSFMGTSTRGDFSSAFGGGSPSIYLDKEGQLKLGMTEDRTKLYLKYMQTWYSKKWLDQGFSARSSDTFYLIDTGNITSGRTAAYIGHKSSQNGNVLENDDLPLTKGIMVVGAPLPMNDYFEYAGLANPEEYRFVEPDTIYMEGKVSSKCMITNTAADKNIPALLNFIDYLYSPEGAEICSLGLNKQQYEESQDSFYKKWGMTNGAYEKTGEYGYDEGGKLKVVYKWAEGNPEDKTLNTALRLHRVPFGLHLVGSCDHGYRKMEQKTIDCWNRYPNTGDIMNELTAKVAVSDEYNRAYKTFMEVLQTGRLAACIKTKSEKGFDTTWNDMLKALGNSGDIVRDKLWEALSAYN